MGLRLPKPGQSLADLYPEIAAQADGWDPTVATLGSARSMQWKCELGHKWNTSVRHRVLGSKCPTCTNVKILPGFNDLATTHPELAAQAVGWDPTTLGAGANMSVDWQCEFGHQWKTSVAHRQDGTGCPVCLNRKVLPGFNDLATTHPELAAQADGWDPRTLGANSHQKKNWKCSHGHEWSAACYSRTLGKGCPICSGNVVLSGFNDLETAYTELAAEADGWDPSAVTWGSGKKRAWICAEGHRWNAIIGNRIKGVGCPMCSGHSTITGVNDLATTHPGLAAEADGWDPTTLKSHSGKKVNWQCPEGHKWIAAIFSRASGIGCPICSGRTVLAGLNDLATTHPELAAQADGWDPSTLKAGSNKKRTWRCEQGHFWTAPPNTRLQGKGCPSCAQTGFDPNQTGWLYLIENDALQMFQIGISNFPDSRLQQHSNRSWEVMEIRGPMEGHLARQMETAILHAVERRGAILGHKAGIEKFDGYSEAWTKDSLTVSSFKQLLGWVYEDEYPGK